MAIPDEAKGVIAQSIVHRALSLNYRLPLEVCAALAEQIEVDHSTQGYSVISLSEEERSAAQDDFIE